MVIGDLDVEGVASLPAEAYTPLLVDADAMLSGAITAQRLQTVGRRYAEVDEVAGVVNHGEFVEGALLNVAWQAPRPLLVPDLVGLGVREAFYHEHKRYNISAKRQ
jgi:hypothetical protein